MIYFYKREAFVMDANQAEQVMNGLEIGLRGGKLKYNSSSIYQSQIDGIKATWPDKHRTFMRDLVVKSGPEPGPAVIRKALERTLAESLATDRASLRNTFVQTEMKAISSDLCLSMLFRVAPDVSPNPGPRKFGKVMVATRTLGETNPRRVIVKKVDVETADVFVFFLFNSELMRSWAIGWMGKSDILALPAGNKTTDPENCPWSQMCHHGSIENARPMFELLQKEGVSECCEGVMFERLPDFDEVPIKTRTQMEEYMNGRASSADEFWQAIGINPTSKTTEEKPKF